MGDTDHHEGAGQGFVQLMESIRKQDDLIQSWTQRPWELWKTPSDIEPGQQARDTEFSKRCANGGKTTASTCQFSSRTTCFSTVCIVRQFPWPAFDWRHLPIYRMNPFFKNLREDNRGISWTL